MRKFVCAIFLLALFIGSTAHAMSSTNFQINWDTINTGGLDTATSANFGILDTVGNQAVGLAGDAVYSLNAGYRISDSTSTAPIIIPPGGGGPIITSSAPVISNVLIFNITQTSSRVTWNTDISSNSAVEYGLTIGYGSGTVSNASFVTGHTIDLSSLTPNTLYHLRVHSADSLGNASVSSDYTFTTLPTTPVTALVISSVFVTDITDHSVRVTWQTNHDADSRVDYGLTPSYGSVSTNASLVSSHSATLAGLQPSTVYHFFITSVDASSTSAVTTDATFTTSADVTPPANVTSLTAVGGDAVIHLNWTNPPDADFSGTRLVRKLGSFPLTPVDGTVVYSGAGTSFNDTSIVNGTTYYYGAFAFDTTGNFASGAFAFATPSAVPIPTPTSTPSVPPVVPPVTPPVVLPPGSPVPTTSTPTPGGTVLSIHPHFYGAAGTVELMPDASNVVSSLAGSTVVVAIPVSGLGGTPDRAYVTVGGSTYGLAPSSGGTTYSGSFVAPSSRVPMSVSMTFVGGGSAVADYTFNPEFPGRVVQQTVTGPTDTGIDGAQVTLFVNHGGTWEPWNGAPYGQPNPTVTDRNGSFAFIVPNGVYYAEIQKEGYDKAVTVPRYVGGNVFSEAVSLVQSMVPLLKPNATVQENISNAARGIVTNLGVSAARVKNFLDQPSVQASLKGTVSPTLLGIAVVNVASALPLFNAAAYLQYLFTQPILIFGRRRKKQWGIIYNSLTKQPIELAIVRLLDATTKVVVQTRVTDKFGRYSFFAKPGSFLIEAVKPGYVFPTEYLKEKTEDVDYTDLYHGSPVTMSDQNGGVIAMNIPMDPVVAEEAPAKIIWRKLLRGIQQSSALITVIVAMVVLVIAPSLQVALLLLAQVGLYLMFRRLGVPVKAKEWGIVYDEASSKPINRVVVRIFDKKFNKLLETQVTDSNGKYGFFVRRNVYYVTGEKEGFEKYVSPDLDLTTKDEALVDQNIALKKAK